MAAAAVATPVMIPRSIARTDRKSRRPPRSRALVGFGLWIAVLIGLWTAADPALAVLLAAGPGLVLVGLVVLARSVVRDRQLRVCVPRTDVCIEL